MRQTVQATFDDHANQGLAEIVGYSYWFWIDIDHAPSELLTFQWTPNAPPPERRYPHLHVGSLVTSGSRFRPGDFNKLHIPTGRLPLEAVLLFAIEELSVEPARGRDREVVVELLRAADRRFLLPEAPT